MAGNTDLPIFASAVAGWRSALNSFKKMPLTFLMGFVAVFAVHLVIWLVVAGGWPVLGTPLASANGLTMALVNQFSAIWFATLLGGVISNLAIAFVVTPVAIVVHRDVLLVETTSVYKLKLGESSFGRFFGFAAALRVIEAVPGMVDSRRLARRRPRCRRRSRSRR